MKSNIPNGLPVISSRTRETMMLGEVPISVTMPPSSEPNAIGINSADTGLSFLRASWNAIGIIIASAPMFFTNADRMVTLGGQHDDLHLGARQIRADRPDHALDHAGARHRRAHQQRARDDDHDVLGEAGERLVVGHDADEDRGEQARERDQVVAQPPPGEHRHHDEEDAEGEVLVEGH